MTQYIDRRLNGKNKSAVNRQRFIRRFKKQIKRSVSNAIAGRNISDIDKGENVSIPKKDISEPVIHHGQGGYNNRIHPGNQDFVTGDRVKRPPSGGGQGQGDNASDSGEGEDEFIFELSREEFLEFFFEDLELPDLVKTKLAKVEAFKTVRAGHTPVGVPSNINIVRSMKGALARRIALQNPHKHKYRNKLKELDALEAEPSVDETRVKQLIAELEALERKIRAIPFIDEFDLRYNNLIKQPKPTTQAVMFCLMDVSGSMDQMKKDMGKRFFMLLYLFLSRNYEKIDIVFVRHHTVAAEVDEQEFFYSRETGGTIVSSALDMMNDIIRDRYPSEDWNIYAAQASDGDNWSDDSPKCRDLLLNQIMPLVQYYAYIEITQYSHQSLWMEYQNVQQEYPNFAMQRIESPADIYPVFRKLFQKKVA